MPGNPSASRSSCTSSVMTPRSSAITGKRPERLLGGTEERQARPRRPPAFPRGLRGCGNRPVPGEPAEVVDPEDVDEVEHAAHPLDPPAVVVGGHRLPVVERVAPQLAEVVEGVRRGARDELVEGEEELGVSPMVAAAGRDVDRHVADDADAPSGRVAAQREPLALEPHLLLDGVAAGVRRPVVAPASLPCPERPQLARLDPRLRIGEQPAPRRERRRGGIRGAELVGRVEGQDLPPAGPCGRQPVDEGERLRPQPAARQRGGMELDAD